MARDRFLVHGLVAPLLHDGRERRRQRVLGIMSMIIGVPTGVKVFNWLFTIYRRRLVLSTPVLYSLGFMVTFVIGGLTGVLLAVPPIDFVLHNTVFLIAHFHNVIIGGVLFGMLAGYNYRFPKAFWISALPLSVRRTGRSRRHRSDPPLCEDFRAILPA
jgi:heme/copper-type cytochrome/quinol oxidase subunit 1